VQASAVYASLNRIIAQLRSLPEVYAVIVAGRDGMVVGADSSKRLEPRMVAAMAASIVGTSEMAVEELGIGRFLEVMIDSDDCSFIGIGAGDDAILVALVKRDVNAGSVLLKMRESAKETEAFLLSGEGRELLDGLHGRAQR